MRFPAARGRVETEIKFSAGLGRFQCTCAHVERGGVCRRRFQPNRETDLYLPGVEAVGGEQSVGVDGTGDKAQREGHGGLESDLGTNPRPVVPEHRRGEPGRQPHHGTEVDVLSSESIESSEGFESCIAQLYEGPDRAGHSVGYLHLTGDALQRIAFLPQLCHCSNTDEAPTTHLGGVGTRDTSQEGAPLKDRRVEGNAGAHTKL